MKNFFFVLAVCAALYKGIPTLVEASTVANEIKAHNEQISLAVR